MADEFARRETRVFIIGSGIRPVADLSARLLRSPHAILYDEDRAVYRNYGLDKRMGLTQRSGTFVVDEVGRIRYAHATMNPFDAFRKRDVLASLPAPPETAA